MNRAVAALLLVLAQALHGSPAGDAARRLVVEGAAGQVGRTVVYDGLYRRLAYPGGDLPVERGSCTDVVVWAIPTPHIGIVSDKTGEERPLMIHKIGAGAVVEDVLFACRVTDHFRFPA